MCWAVGCAKTGSCAPLSTRADRVRYAHSLESGNEDSKICSRRGRTPKEEQRGSDPEKGTSPGHSVHGDFNEPFAWNCTASWACILQSPTAPSDAIFLRDVYQRNICFFRLPPPPEYRHRHFRFFSRFSPIFPPPPPFPPLRPLPLLARRLVFFSNPVRAPSAPLPPSLSRSLLPARAPRPSPTRIGSHPARRSPRCDVCAFRSHSRVDSRDSLETVWALRRPSAGVAARLVALPPFFRRESPAPAVGASRGPRRRLASLWASPRRERLGVAGAPYLRRVLASI